nr:MAG TPA: hypothetical protein [Caudoviricetes sp.]
MLILLSLFVFFTANILIFKKCLFYLFLCLLYII